MPMIDEALPWLRLGGFLLFFVAVFRLTRSATSRWLQDDWAARKIVLYALAFGGVLGLLAINKAVDTGLIGFALLLLIVAFLAILTAK